MRKHTGPGDQSNDNQEALDDWMGEETFNWDEGDSQADSDQDYHQSLHDQEG